MHKTEIRRLIIFGMVGTFNTCVCYGLYAALLHALKWHHNGALVADYAFGAVLGFATHRLATFADRKHVRQAFGKYLTTLGVAFLLNVALLNAIVASGILDPLLAQAAAIGHVTLVSYMLQKHWVFRSHDQPAGPVGGQSPDIVLIERAAPERITIGPVAVARRRAA